MIESLHVTQDINMITPMNSFSAEDPCHSLDSEISSTSTPKLSSPSDAEITSLASAAALVSENILDSTFASNNTHQTKKNINSDEKGINRHTYSADQIKRIISEYRDVSEDDPPNDDRAPIHPANYSSFLREQQKRHLKEHRQQKSKETLKENESSSEGYIDSAVRWISQLRLARQREALVQAVEEQRKVLLCESLKAQREECRRNSIDESVHQLSMGLDTNPTFQSISSPQPRTSALLAISICGGVRHVLDDELVYYIDGNGFQVQCHDEDEDGSGGTFQQSVSYDGYFHSNPVSSPMLTVSGEGLAVKLDIPARENTLKREPSICINIVEEPDSNVPYILTKPQMEKLVSSGLPASLSFCKWKRNYSLLRDGDSFNSCFLQKVKNIDKTLLVIQTTNGSVMGGFASSPWENHSDASGSRFYGSAQALLFSVDKSTKDLNIFKWSGLNRYIQICNAPRKMLGFGGGGKEGEFGLCVEDDFRTGSTGKCATFNNEPLCDEDYFEVLNVECWSFVFDF